MIHYTSGSRSSGGRSSGSSRSRSSSFKSSGSSRSRSSGSSGGLFGGGGLSSSSRSSSRRSKVLSTGGSFNKNQRNSSGGNFSSGMFNKNRGPGGCGCGTSIIILVIIGIIIIFILSSGGGLFSSGSSGNNDITISTIEREALPSGSVNETGYYTDELDWIGNQTKLLSGLKYFYKKTGVQPYLFITGTINGSYSPSSDDLDDFANDLYDELFTDEAHLLFVFFEYEGDYMDRYVAGTQAKSVVDTEAADILLDYIDRYYYYDDLTDEEFFSMSFKDAADRIMKVTRSPWIPVFIVICVLALIIILYFWWRHAKKQKNLEAQQTEKILKTPLEKFGDTQADELAEKYEDKKEQ